MKPQRQIIAFAGPSLTTADRTRMPHIDWRDPAMAGDLLRVADGPPRTICLIDGLFDQCPAPWHKEILALLELGFPVYGAASMGALRAAELDRFGMVGVGAIYRAYRSGALTGDDEVALAHATGALGWAPVTVPLVEVRATLIMAVRKGLIDAAQAPALRDCWQAIFFADRDWPLMSKLALTQGLADAESLDAITKAHVPLKRVDALACLKMALESAPVVPSPPRFPRTYFFYDLENWVRA